MSVYYTILPVDSLQEGMPVYEQINYRGYEILACQTEQGYILERLYSTNPTDFLVPSLQPGTLLENSLIKKNNQ